MKGFFSLATVATALMAANGLASDVRRRAAPYPLRIRADAKFQNTVYFPNW